MRDVCNGWRVNMVHDICEMYVMLWGSEGYSYLSNYTNTLTCHQSECLSEYCIYTNSLIWQFYIQQIVSFNNTQIDRLQMTCIA